MSKCWMQNTNWCELKSLMNDINTHVNKLHVSREDCDWTWALLLGFDPKVLLVASPYSVPWQAALVPQRNSTQMVLVCRAIAPFSRCKPSSTKIVDGTWLNHWTTTWCCPWLLWNYGDMDTASMQKINGSPRPSAWQMNARTTQQTQKIVGSWYFPHYHWVAQ